MVMRFDLGHMRRLRPATLRSRAQEPRLPAVRRLRLELLEERALLDAGGLPVDESFSGPELSEPGHQGGYVPNQILVKAARSEHWRVVAA
jgi:hypothetical protein